MERASLTLLAALAVAIAGTDAGAQAWPTRPIRVIVPFTAGSNTDIIARVVLDQLSAQFGQSIVVENRTGAGGTVGAAFVEKSEPDGYTSLIISSAHTIIPAFYPNLTYDPARDFSAVIPLGNSPNVLVVSPSRRFKTVHELVAAAKAKPGSFNVSGGGVGTGNHMSAERFRASAGIEVLYVPFKGGPESMSEVMAGRLDYSLLPVGLVLPHLRDGKLLALAVNSAKRSPALPDVPTLAECGFVDADYLPWYGLFLPAKTPRETVNKLHREMTNALQTPRVHEKLTSIGVEPMVMSPAEFDARVKEEIVINAALAKTMGIRSN
jgi:tripartite-type tricarboxylate transporter receptor subunit TctC